MAVNEAKGSFIKIELKTKATFVAYIAGKT
jgi:hypothetical protein